MQGVIRWLLPREDHFYDFLERQAVIAHDAAKALSGLAGGEAPQTVTEAVQTIERQGDKVVREMEEALGKTFVTPIDREDLQRICQELDDIVDAINISARYFHVYRVPTLTDPMRELLALTVEGTRQLKDALPRLRKADWAALMETSRSLRTLEKKGDEIFRRALTDLFDDAGIDPRDLLRQKELLEDFENAVDHCMTVANTLANLSVKHG